MRDERKTKAQLIQELAELRRQAGNLEFQELKESREYLEKVLENSPDGISIVDKHGRFIKWNSSAVELFGYSYEELKGKLAFELYDDQNELNKMLELLRRNGVVKKYEINIKKKDGTVHPFALSIRMLKDNENRTIGSVCVARDVSETKRTLNELKKINFRINQEIIERKKAVKTLRESEKRYRLLVSNIPAIVFKGYWDWAIDFFDDKIEELTGYRKEDFNSRKLRWKNIVLEQYIPYIQQVFKEALKTSRSYVSEYRVRAKGGKISWVQERSQIICSPDGRVDYVSGVIFDITERRQAEDDLRRAHAEIEQLFASINSILIGLTPSGQVWHWNREAEMVLGVKSGEALGKRLHKIPLLWDGVKVSEALGECRKRCQPVRVDDVRFRRQGGKDGFLGISISPIKESGEVSGLILLGRDITERRVLEMQLAQAQKLESIGQLAAGIAHEINTPIQYLGDNTRFLRDACEDLFTLLEKYKALLEAGKSGVLTADLLSRVEAAVQESDLEYLVAEIPAAIGQSLEGVERVAKIVRAMKDFSHPGSGEKHAVDINKALESTITVARNEWKYVAEMITDFDPSLPLVPCRPEEINQVFLNIIINAAQAIAEAGGREPAEKGRIAVKTGWDGNGVHISFSDTGGGIPEEIRSRIFDPFFTTKEVGKGTGQGLAICHAVVVEKHGGAINFESALGQGTTFTIHLPVENNKPKEGEAIET